MRPWGEKNKMRFALAISIDHHLLDATDMLMLTKKYALITFRTDFCRNS
jgi:hypothetical protein